MPLARLVRNAGSRWAAKECFQVGLYTAWHRHASLAMLARGHPHVHHGIRTAAPTNSPPDDGHDGGTATENAPADVTTTNNTSKVTQCGWSTAALAATMRPGPGRAAALDAIRASRSAHDARSLPLRW
jgi:hypothetical protein